jgi:hypothetical protein
VEDFSSLAGEKFSRSKMITPSLFAVPTDLPVSVFNGPEMRADTVARLGVLHAFNDIVSDKANVPG